MDFFPTTLDEWLGLLLAAASVVATAFGIIHRVLVKPLADDFTRYRHDVGERLGKAEQGVSANRSKLDGLDRMQERMHLQVTGISEQFARMEARLQALDTTIYRFHEERVNEDRRAGERLATIEARMGSILERLPVRGA